MKMNKLLSVLTLVAGIIFLMSSSVLAVKTTTIADGWYYYDDSFSKNGCDYRLRGADLYDTQDNDRNYETGNLMVRRTCDDEKTSHVLGFGECEKNSQYQWCFLNASYEDQHVTIDSQGRLQPGIRVLFKEFKYNHKLDVSRSFSSKNLNLGDEVDVTISLSNEGDLPLSDISVKEPIPEGFELLSYDDSFHHVTSERELRSTFNLYPGSVWQKTYTIKAIDYVSPSTRTNITYDTEKESGFYEESSSQTLEVIKPYVISMSSLEKQFAKGDRKTFTLMIENNENEPLDIERLIIRIPSNIKVSSHKPLNDVSPSKYEFSGTIPAFSKETFDADLRFPFIGDYVVSYTAHLAVKEREYYESESSSFSVAADYPTCHFNTSSDSLVAGSSFSYDVFLKHTGKESFYEIMCEVSDPVNGMLNTSIVNIRTGDTEPITSKEFEIPISTTAKNYTFNLTCSYRTDNNQWFDCQKQFTLDVASANISKGAGENISGANVSSNSSASISDDEMNGTPAEDILSNNTAERNGTQDGSAKENQEKDPSSMSFKEKIIHLFRSIFG
ncbi:MAG: hypothetical protein ACOCU6_00040 [Nanoarchaeota archaeon]